MRTSQQSETPEARQARILKHSLNRSENARLGRIQAICNLLFDDPIDFFNLSRVWVPNSNHEKVLSNAPNDVFDDVSQTYTKWYESQRNIMKFLKLDEDQLPNLDLSTLGTEYDWLANSFPKPKEIFYEISDKITLDELREYMTGKSDNTAAGCSKTKHRSPT